MKKSQKRVFQNVIFTKSCLFILPWKYCMQCWHSPDQTCGCASWESRSPCSMTPSLSWGAFPLLYRSRSPPLASESRRLCPGAIFRDRWNNFLQIQSTQIFRLLLRHWPLHLHLRPPVKKLIFNFCISGRIRMPDILLLNYYLYIWHHHSG